MSDEKDNNFNDDLFLFKAFDIKYSGITNQLIFNFDEKKNKLKKINNGFLNINKNENKENCNFDFIKYEDDKNIIDDVFENKTFLKSENITSKIKKIKERKFISQKWNYFSKEFKFYYVDEINKVCLIQRNFKLYLFRKKNYNKGNKKIIMVKVLKIILRECIVCHVRKTIFEDFKRKIPIINKIKLNNQSNDNNNMKNNIDILLSPNKEKNKLINNSESEIIKTNDNFTKLNNEKINDNNNKIIEKNENKIIQNQNLNQIKKLKSNLLFSIKNKQEEIKKEAIQNYNNKNIKLTNNNNINKINNNNIKKKEIFIQTKIIDNDIPIKIYNTEENKKQKNNFIPSNFIILRGTIDSNDSQNISPKNNIKKIKNEKTIDDSGSIIYNDREIYVNKNYYNNCNKNFNKQKKMRTAFFNVIVNNIKK